MKFFENIKEIARNRSLRKASRMQTRKKMLVNLSKAGSVGILFEVPDDAAYQTVYLYIQKLQEMRLRVTALGYVKEKNLASHFLPILSFDFLYEKNLNWYGKPVAKRPVDFWSSEFDICINIGSSDCFPLKYIACRSVSHLKVGPYTEKDKDYYDLMIIPDTNHDQGRFLQQVHDYLTILNPKENV